MGIEKSFRGKDPQRSIFEMIDRAKNLAPLYKDAANLMDATVIKKAFRQQADPVTGEAWAELQKPRRRQGRRKADDVILNDAGKLREQSQAKGTRDAVEYGITGPARDYGGVHLTGGKHHDRRRFLPVDGKDWRDGMTTDFSGGDALAWWEKFRRRVDAWIFEGKAL